MHTHAHTLFLPSSFYTHFQQGFGSWHPSLCWELWPELPVGLARLGALRDRRAPLLCHPPGVCLASEEGAEAVDCVWVSHITCNPFGRLILQLQTL